MSRKSLSDKLNREVKYTNKDFGELRKGLINYAKNYFPTTYNDFNESSPGMMFIEMAAYVGDVLNFYSDVQLQESFLYTVNEKINLYNLSQGMGFKPKTIVPAQVDLDIMQLVPAKGTGQNTEPDFSYALTVNEGMIVRTDEGTQFRTVQPVDFRHSSSLDPTVTSVYSVLNDGSIEYYLLKKHVKAVQGQVVTQTFEFTDPKIYDKITLLDSNIGEIIDVVDSDGNIWYEVPYLAQDLVPIAIRNIEFNDPELSQFRSSVPYLLCYKQTEKRFVTRLRKDDLMEIQFGAGLSSEADEEIIPNPMNVGIGLEYYKRVDDLSIDPSNFLYTKTYGSAPNNTTLTVRYSISNGLSGNVASNTINNILDVDIESPSENLDTVLLTDIIDSLSVTNQEAAYGGLNRRPIDTVREEAMANFAAQNRAVTKEDYILRCYTMPSKYGAIAKAYIEQDIQNSQWNSQEKVPNPFALNLYILSVNENGQFVASNRAIKENLRNYLRQYRLMTDSINIKDAFIINIGVEYEIITRPDYNSYDVLLRCNARLMELLDNSKMEINAPIMLSNLMVELDKIEGVQTVENLEIINLTDVNEGYSSNVYPIEEAKRHNVIYPSLDPCIFEVKFPKKDIRGRVIDL